MKNLRGSPTPPRGPGIGPGMKTLHERTLPVLPVLPMLLVFATATPLLSGQAGAATAGGEPAAAAQDPKPEPDAKHPLFKHLNLDKRGLAIGGFDPVAYFPEGGGKATKGKKKLAAVHRGVTYRFATEANKQLFVATPERFEPRYGGWCAWAMADGKGDKVEVDPESFTVEDGKLYLFYDGLFGNTRKKWKKKGSAPSLGDGPTGTGSASRGPSARSPRSRRLEPVERARGLVGECAAALLPVLLQRMDATSDRLRFLNGSEDRTDGAEAPRIDPSPELRRAARELERQGWLMGVVAGALGVELLGERRYPQGLAALLELVGEALAPGGRRIAATEGPVPIVGTAEAGGPLAAWTLAVLLWDAARHLPVRAAPLAWNLTQAADGRCVMSVHTCEEPEGSRATRRALASALPGARYEVHDNVWTLSLPAGALLPGTEA